MYKNFFTIDKIRKNDQSKVTMFRAFAILFAVLYLGLGILGFFLFSLETGRLFYVFQVNAPTNIIHFFIGCCALGMVFLKERHLILYFQIIGVVLGIWAVLGFLYGENLVFSFLANNPPLTWLHMVSSVVALILGFGSKEL